MTILGTPFQKCPAPVGATTVPVGATTVREWSSRNTRRHFRNGILSVVLLCAVPLAGVAQPADAFDLNGKLRFHAESIYSPWSMAGSAAYAGILQGLDAPEEWGQGTGA